MALLLSGLFTDGLAARHFAAAPVPPLRPSDLVEQDGPPLPPARPGDLRPANPVPVLPMPPVAPAPVAAAPAPFVPAPDPTCPAVLQSKEIVVAAATAVSGPNGCGIATPVTLSAVILKDGTKVPFEPPSLIRCDLAETLGTWFREDVAPALKPAGGLAKILGSNGYECRNRDHLVRAKLSEHAKGNALDLRGFVLRNGQTILIEKDAPQPVFLTQIRATACTRFRTVLGPGGDVFHETHLHVDLEQRHHDFRICEWNVTPPAFGPKMPAQGPKMPKVGSGIDVHGRHT
ncbi:MAG: extensin family protein [Methylovirgula sp.]|uniref:extensin-like domain-containing protein n=1 Tax=Methylovirgula sp. TaxID=1978224 RepID=UPI0030762E67